MQISPRSLLSSAFLVLGLSTAVEAQTNPQNFVSITPCRLADTRISSGGSGPIPGGTYQTFPVVGAAAVDGGTACNIPPNAAAFSLNVTAVPNPSGSSLLYLSVLPAPASAPTTPPNSSTLNDPSGTIIANAAMVPSGVNGAEDVFVSSMSDVILDIDGYFVNQTSSKDTTAVGTGAGGSTGTDNTAVGYNALPSGSGRDNTALGSSALTSDTSGFENTAVGVQALFSNSTGSFNVAVGYESFYSNTSGTNDSAFGHKSLYSNTTGGWNAAFGDESLYSNTTGADNAAFGHSSLYSNTTGVNNAALGFRSLASNTSGAENVAFGADALSANSTGANNAAVGSGALINNTTGSSNSALGYQSLFSNTTGNYNTSIGQYALHEDSTGGGNTAVGAAALGGVTTGSDNIGIGNNSGQNVTYGSNNIDIGNPGGSSDSGLIRIGTANTQTEAIIAGIYGVTITGGAPVLINGYGQLGVQSSSIRYKEDVHDMASGTDALMQLRPVEFRYKQAEADGSKPLQFGLVAEEVAQVYPELVVRGKDGQVDSVQYHQLPAMLLNEIQKQHRTIEDLQADKAEQDRKIQTLESEMEKLRAIVVSK